jgi:hypothetical protein
MSRFTMPRADSFDTSGNPRAGARLYFYATGTTTPLDTYTSSAMSVANANPVVADGAGVFPEIFLADASYKVVLKTSADVTVWTADPVVANPTSASLTPTITTIVDAAITAAAPLGMITADTTLAVPSAYATIATALDYLNGKWISPDATVTIQVAAGTHTHTVPIVITHPCAAQIHIKGTAAISHTLVSQQSVSGTAGAYDVVVNVSTVGTALVGEYLLIHTDTTGTGDHYAHRGVWRITAVDSGNNRFTLRNTNWSAAFPANTLTGGTAYRLTTVLKFNNCDGFVVNGAVLGRLEDVAIVGNAEDYWSSANVSGTEKGTFGIIVSGETVAQNGKTDNENQFVIAQGSVSFGQYVGVSDFDQQGVVCSSGGSIFGRYGASSSNRRRGWYAEACGQIQCKNSIGSGNFLDGYIADVGGAIICNLSTASGNGGNGISSVQGGSMTATTCVATGNLTHGFHARGGFLNCGPSTSTSNAADGYHAEYGGVILASSAVATSNANDGFEANHGSVIRALNATANTNGRYGVRASSGGNIDCTTLTAAGNVTADKSTMGMGILIDTTYEDFDVPAGLVVGAAVTAGTNITATGYLRSNNGANNVQIATTSAGDLGLTFNSTGRFVFKTGGVFHPSGNGTQDLGRTTEKWLAVYGTNLGASGTRFTKLWTVDIDTTNAAVVSSDARNKTDIVDEPLGLDFINSLRPVQYKLIDSGDGRPGVRPHHGLLAQELKAVLDGLGIDHAAFIDTPVTVEVMDDDGEPTGRFVPTGETKMGIRYSELVSSLIKAVQELSARVAALEAK